MAGRFSVESVFKAVDRVTAPVSRMQNRVLKFTRSMTRGLRAVNRQVGKVVRALGRGLGGVAKFGGALLAIGGAAVVAAINRTANAADALAKQSRRLKFPIEELQEWKFVAEQSGVSNELLDKSLGAFSKRLGEARGGIGPLVSGLKKINPQLLQQLQNTESVSDAFALYIDAMRNTSSATGRAALANAAFSRSGLKLANIADNSAAAIAALRKQQRENGNITMEQAEAAEAYNDAVNNLKRALFGLLHGVVLPLLPAITETVTRWREWVVANKQIVQTRVLAFARDLKDRIMAIVSAVVEFNNKYDLAERIGSGLDTMGRFGVFLAENAGTILKVVAAVVALSAVLNTLVAVMAVVNAVMALNPVGLVVVGIVAAIAAFTALWTWVDKIAAKFDGLPLIFKIAFAPVYGLVKAVKWLKDNMGSIVDGARDLKNSATDLGRSAVDKTKQVASDVADWLGFGQSAVDKTEQAARVAARSVINGDENEEDAGPGAGSTVVSPQERTARMIEERRTTSAAELTIKDETGRASITRGGLPAGVTLQPSGAF